ncbi:hypothetical protein TNCV_1509921 [Trichonephila clavipes]|nr:hypothetical protein TNCV_1509921 [Trichonephila clavipes]
MSLQCHLNSNSRHANHELVIMTPGPHVIMENPQHVKAVHKASGWEHLSERWNSLLRKFQMRTTLRTGISWSTYCYVADRPSNVRKVYVFNTGGFFQNKSQFILELSRNYNSVASQRDSSSKPETDESQCKIRTVWWRVQALLTKSCNRTPDLRSLGHFFRIHPLDHGRPNGVLRIHSFAQSH